MKNDFKNFSDFEKEKNILNIPLVSESNETGYKVEGEEKKIKLPNTLSETIIKELDNSLVDIIEQAYDIEYELLKKYNISSNKIFVEGDIATFDFLKFFRDTQIGEVREYSDFLNALQLIDATDKYQILYFENHYF